MELTEEIAQLVEQVSTSDDAEVLNSSVGILLLCKTERATVESILGALAMPGAEQVSEEHPMLRAIAERLRNRLTGLLQWARDTGRA